MSHHWDERVGFYAARTVPEGSSRTLDERLKDVTVRVQDAERLPRGAIDFGKFPHGKLISADKGAFRYTVTPNPTAQIVKVDFGGAVTAVGLTLAETEKLIESLTAATRELRGVKP